MSPTPPATPSGSPTPPATPSTTPFRAGESSLIRTFAGGAPEAGDDARIPFLKAPTGVAANAAGDYLVFLANCARVYFANGSVSVIGSCYTGNAYVSGTPLLEGGVVLGSGSPNVMRLHSAVGAAFNGSGWAIAERDTRRVRFVR